MVGARKLSEDDVKEICLLFSERRLPITVISRKYGIHHTTVSYHLIRNGIYEKYKGITKLELEEIKKLMDKRRRLKAKQGSHYEKAKTYKEYLKADEKRKKNVTSKKCLGCRRTFNVRAFSRDPSHSFCGQCFNQWLHKQKQDNLQS